MEFIHRGERMKKVTKKKVAKKSKTTEAEKSMKKMIKAQEKEHKKIQAIGKKCEAFEKEMRELCKKHNVDMIAQAWLKKDKIFFSPVSEIKCELKFTAIRAKALEVFKL